jgi:hypothetical protein
VTAEPRTCICGCGKPIPEDRPRNARYVDQAHAYHARNLRRRLPPGAPKAKPGPKPKPKPTPKPQVIPLKPPSKRAKQAEERRQMRRREALADGLEQRAREVAQRFREAR